MPEQRRVSDVLNGDGFDTENSSERWIGNIFYTIRSKTPEPKVKTPEPELKISVKGRLKNRWWPPYDAFYLSIELDGKEIIHEELENDGFKKMSIRGFIGLKFCDYVSFLQLVNNKLPRESKLDEGLANQLRTLDSRFGLGVPEESKDSLVDGT